MADLAVLVPTLHRADKLEPLLENIAASTAVSHRTYLIVEYDDHETAKVLPGLPEHTAVFGEFGSCAKAMNAGYAASVEPFVFTANDDLWLHEGWDGEALEALAFNPEPKHVCGTNDGHGRMTCFAMVRRSFIEQHSGVFDKPNTLYHEYVSQYCDTELAEYAKHRGVWTEAPDAVTEHLHWEHGKADRDHPNYQKAAATCGQDQRVYSERSRAWQESPSLELQASSDPTS